MSDISIGICLLAKLWSFTVLYPLSRPNIFVFMYRFRCQAFQMPNHWSLGIDKQFHPTLYNGCNDLSMLWLTLNNVNKRGPSWKTALPISLCISMHSVNVESAEHWCSGESLPNINFACCHRNDGGAIRQQQLGWFMPEWALYNRTTRLFELHQLTHEVVV